MIATCAVSKLESVCTNIQNGNITITELESIKAKETQMNKLCDIISETQSVELQKSMTQRLREFEHFDNYKAKLEYFLSHIGNKLMGKEMNQYEHNCTHPLMLCSAMHAAGASYELIRI